jgi:hypothetical protein
MAKRAATHKDHEQDITLATIDQQLKGIIEKDDLIYKQVQATNGRVKSLEIWRAYMIGGGIVLITIIGWLINAIYH